MTCEMTDIRNAPLMAEKNLARISYHSVKLFHQTREILEFSKTETGNVGLIITGFTGKEALEESLSLFSESNGNRLICVAYPDDVLVRSDRQKIISVIHILADNASKNTRNGVISVRLRLAGDNLIIRVRDDGCGFDIRTLKMLYQPFNQGAESHTKQGLGLGLTIVHRYVKILGGKIRARSAINKGSVFTVKILSRAWSSPYRADARSFIPE